jgi:hypothetical protein
MPISKEPLVVCVMPVEGRLEMCKRAIRSFDRQTYRHRKLAILDTGDPLVDGDLERYCGQQGIGNIMVPCEDIALAAGNTLGGIRNAVNEFAVSQGAEIIAHWDSDDWSHPLRLEEQVRLLRDNPQDSQCVGYNHMLFWCTAEQAAYRYSLNNYCLPLGTSFCYTAEFWQNNRFKEFTPNGAEDVRFLSGPQRAYAVSSLSDGVPRMIATIHGGNTCSRINRDPRQKEWSAAPAWTTTCRLALSL